MALRFGRLLRLMPLDSYVSEYGQPPETPESGRRSKHKLPRLLESCPNFHRYLCLVVSRRQGTTVKSKARRCGLLEEKKTLCRTLPEV